MACTGATVSEADEPTTMSVSLPHWGMHAMMMAFGAISGIPMGFVGRAVIDEDPAVMSRDIGRVQENIAKLSAKVEGLRDDLAEARGDRWTRTMHTVWVREEYSPLEQQVSALETRVRLLELGVKLK